MLRSIIRNAWIANHEVGHRGILREQISGWLPPDPFRDFRAVQFLLPRIRQRLIHVPRDDQRIRRLPGPGLVFQKRELQWQLIAMLFDESIYPPRICFHDGARARVHLSDFTLRCTAKTQSSKLLIDFQRGWSEDLRQLPPRDASQ